MILFEAVIVLSAAEKLEAGEPSCYSHIMTCHELHMRDLIIGEDGHFLTYPERIEVMLNRSPDVYCGLLRDYYGCIAPIRGDTTCIQEFFALDEFMVHRYQYECIDQFNATAQFWRCKTMIEFFNGLCLGSYFEKSCSLEKVTQCFEEALDAEDSPECRAPGQREGIREYYRHYLESLNERGLVCSRSITPDDIKRKLFL